MPATSAWAALRVRDIRLYVIGLTLSLFGDPIFLVVAGIRVKDLAGSDGAAGMVDFCIRAPSLVGPLFALPADRVPRRRLLVVVVISGVVAAYAAVVITLHWDPERVWLAGFGLATSGLTYGGLGVVLGFALSTELSGMFVIIMVNLVEVMVQNPVTNPSSDQSVVRFAPTCGSIQTGTTAGFTDQASWGCALLGLLWTAVFGAVAVAAFHRRTKDHTCRDPGSSGGVPWSPARRAPTALSRCGPRPARWCTARNCRGARPTATATDRPDPPDPPSPRKSRHRVASSAPPPPPRPPRPPAASPVTRHGPRPSTGPRPHP